MPRHFTHLSERLRAAWPGSFRQQITRPGLLYFCAVAVVTLAAFASGNNLLYLILAVMFAVLFISNFVSKIVMSGLQVDVAIPLHVSARRQTPCLLRLKNAKHWMPSFSIHISGMLENGFDCALYFPLVPGGATVEDPVQAFFPKRGTLKERSFLLTTRFPFGFGERRELVTLRQEIVVYPCIDPQPGFELLLSSVQGEIEILRRGQGQDFHRIRPYEWQESWRHVDWKASAHTGALQVREYAHEDDEGVLIYLDLNVPKEHDAWFENCVDCAAYLAHELADHGRKLRLRSQDVDLRVPGDGDVYNVLKYLAFVARRPGAASTAPDETIQYQIVFSPNAESMAELGWAKTSAHGQGGGGRILGPDTWDKPGTANATMRDNEPKVGSL